MPDHDSAFDDAIREIAHLLAATYLRLRFRTSPANLTPRRRRPNIVPGGDPTV
jgi:hypothetical protein